MGMIPRPSAAHKSLLPAALVGAACLAAASNAAADAVAPLRRGAGGALPPSSGVLGDRRRGRGRDAYANAAAASPSDEEESWLDSRVLTERFNRAHREAKRRAKERRGPMTEKEERQDVASQRRARRDRRIQKQRRARRLGGGGGRRRRLQSGTNVDGFIISGLSPIFRPESFPNTTVLPIWCAGIIEDRPPAGQPLGMRDLQELFLIPGRDPDEPSDFPEIFWDIEVEDADKRQSEAFLPELVDENDKCFDDADDDDECPTYYMEIKKQKKNKLVYVTEQNTYNPNQLFDFRPGGLTDIVESTEILRKLTDRTWRPSFQLGNKEFCIEPVLTNGTTIEEFNPLRQKVCKNNGFKRERQIWVYCVAGDVCETDEVDPPTFELSVDCVEADTESLQCNDGFSNQNLDKGEAVDSGIWDNLLPCLNDNNLRDPDRDNKFGKSLVYRMDDDEKDGSGIDLIFTYGDDDDDVRVCEKDDANAIVRVYEQLSNNDWNCLFIDQTDCEAESAAGSEITARLGPTQNSNRDFLVIVSSDGSDVTDDENNLERFDLDVDCLSGGSDDSSGLTSGARTTDGYCFQDTDSSVDDDDSLPNSFATLSTDCDGDDEDTVFDDGDTLQHVVRYVDTKGITLDLTLNSRCDTDDSEDFKLRTLLRVYEIMENSAGTVTGYKCVQSGSVTCENEDDDVDFTTDELSGEDRYLLVVTGAVKVQACDAEDFACR